MDGSDDVLDRTTFEDLVATASVEQLPYKECLDLRAHDAALRERVEALEADRERLMDFVKRVSSISVQSAAYEVRLSAALGAVKESARDLLDDLEPPHAND